jgi:uncharacterized protein YneF (UPF0154 family)
MTMGIDLRVLTLVFVLIVLVIVGYLIALKK